MAFMKKNRRRFLAIALATVLVLTQIPVIRTGKVVAKDIVSFTKIWETKSEDNVKCQPIDALDGGVYGINADLGNGKMDKLVKVKDGSLLWRSQDQVASIGQNFWPIMDFGDKVVYAGLTEDLKRDSNVLEFGFFCYKSDGTKLWEKKYTFDGVIPTFRPYKDKIWLVYDNYVRVIDPSTGNETGKLDLGPSNPKPMSANSITDGGGGGLGNENLKLFFMTLSQDTMVLHQLEGVRAYEITPESTLKLKWFKKYEPGQLTLFDLMLMIQANTEIFLMTNGGGFTCYDSKNGQEIWSVKEEESFFSLIFYNKTHIIKSDLFGSSCYEVKTKQVLWKKDSMILPTAFDDRIIVTNAMIGNDLEVEKNVAILDISTGTQMTTLKENNVSSAVISGNNLYLTKENQLVKYTKCNPCSCDLDVSWKDSKAEKITTEICSLETKEFSISLKNTSKEMTIDCSIASSSNKLMPEATSIKLEPGKQALIKATYSSSIDEPDTTECSIFVTSSCGKSANLLLGVKKTPSCKEKLKKVAQVESQESYIFGNILVSIKYTDDGYFDSLVGTDLSTGKTIWTIGTDKIEDVSSLSIYYMDKDSFICMGDQDELKWFKIDTKGNIIWKRTGGVFMVPNLPIMAIGYEKEVNLDLFDAQTGKNIMTGFRSKPWASMVPIAQYKENYIFSIDGNNSFAMYDTQGKKIWDDVENLCLWKSDFSIGHIYQFETFVSEEPEIVLPYKAIFSKIVPDTLVKTWSVEIEGIPEIIGETKDKVWLKTRFGIYCIDTANGKTVWSMVNDKIEFGETLSVDNKICVLTTPFISDTNDVLSTSMVVLEAQTGKNTTKINVGDSVKLIQDGKNVYSFSNIDTDEGQQFEAYCFDKTTWKEIWKIKEKGYIHTVGSKSFLLTGNNELSWWEDGKNIGKTKISPVQTRENHLSQLRIDWIGEKIYVTGTNDLSVYNSKTSAMLLRIRHEGKRSLWNDGRYRIFVGNYKFSLDIGEYLLENLMAPCWYDGHLYIASDSKLMVFKPTDK